MRNITWLIRLILSKKPLLVNNRLQNPAVRKAVVIVG